MKPSDLCFHILADFPDGVCFTDREQKIRYWNRAAERITGYSEKEMLECGCGQDFLQQVQVKKSGKFSGYFPLADALFEERIQLFQANLHKKDGHPLRICGRMIPVFENGRTVGVAIAFSDDAVQVSGLFSVADLIAMANTDALTGLPNRRGLETVLDRWLLEKRSFIALFYDIDDFKQFNDFHGHATGDEVLCRIADNMIRALDGDDVFGRWGGEEFLGLYATPGGRDAVRIIRRIRTLLKHVRVRTDADEDLLITVSIGATAAKQDDTPGALMHRADELMYHSKRHGKNCVSIDFDGRVRVLPEMQNGETDYQSGYQE